jgi:hypothetical protein
VSAPDPPGRTVPSVGTRTFTTKMNRPLLLPPDVFVPRLAEVHPGALVAEGRILELVADGHPLRGTPSDLARQLDVRIGDLRAAVRELETIGWLTVETGAGGQLSLGLADGAT